MRPTLCLLAIWAGAVLAAVAAEPPEVAVLGLLVDTSVCACRLLHPGPRHDAVAPAQVQLAEREERPAGEQEAAGTRDLAERRRLPLGAVDPEVTAALPTSVDPRLLDSAVARLVVSDFFDMARRGRICTSTATH